MSAFTSLQSTFKTLQSLHLLLCNPHSLLPPPPSNHVNLSFPSHTQNIGSALETFAGEISTIAKSLPSQPPMTDVTNRLTERSNDLSQESSQLQDAIRNLIGAPAQVADAALADLNARLTGLVDGKYLLCGTGSWSLSL